MQRISFPAERALTIAVMMVDWEENLGMELRAAGLSNRYCVTR
ncbi:hypothetical protein [Oceanisphaera ostreae]|uniref:Uncharacterized protein n=1 Tax=Oceanisphaera ostreae TaxID=914151 RepID=A0ABW3KHX7_9GAMM